MLQIDPRDIDALQAVAALYRKLDQPDDLAEILHRLIDSLTLVGGKHRRDPRSVGRVWQAVLGPHHAAPGCDQGVAQGLRDQWRDFRALDALEVLYGAESQWKTRSTSSKRVKLLEKDSQKIAELLKIGHIWEEKVSDLADAAADAYERVQAIDKTNLEASVQLEGIFRTRKNWNQLADLRLARGEFPDNQPTHRIELCSRLPAFTKTT